MHVEENDYGNELCAGDSDDESEEGCEIHVDSSSPTSAIPPLSWPLSTVPPSSSSTSTIAIPPSSPTLTIALSSSAASSVPPPSTSASTTPLPCSVASSFQPNSTATPILLPISAVSAVPLPTPTTSSPAQTYPKLSRLEEQNSLQEELALVRQTKVICSLDLLLDVFKRCQHPGCNKATALKHHLNGPTAVIKWTCSSGHRGTFSTSRDQNEIYANNLQVAASIMLSGNNFAKVEKMANFLGLSFISESTFYRMQRLYFIPAIDEWWSWQREQLIEDFIDQEVVVCGDGQCDSPGHTAKNLCYFLMELVSGYILEIEVRDKPHVGLASTNMEKQALQNALQRLQASLTIVEVVTDASPAIKKMLGKHNN